MLVLEGEVEAGHASPTLVAKLCQNSDHPGRSHGYYGLEALCSAYPGHWAEYSEVRELRCFLSVLSMLVLKQPSPLDLDLDDVEKTASIAAVNQGATEARAVLPGPTAVLPGPTSLTFYV